MGTRAWTLIYDPERVWPWLRCGAPIATVTLGTQGAIACLSFVAVFLPNLPIFTYNVQHGGARLM